MHRFVLPIVLLAAWACERSGLPDPTRVDPGNCGLGPISIPPSIPPGSCPLPAIPGGCPASKPSQARSLLSVETCAFAANETSCVPVTNPVCPNEHLITAFFLHNPNPDYHCLVAAIMDVDAQATIDGGATISWEWQENDPSTCQPTGPHVTGSTSITGPCCRSVTDTYFPLGRFTFRMVFRTDWQQ